MTDRSTTLLRPLPCTTLAALATLAGALTRLPAQAELVHGAELVRSGPHYVVHCHFPSPAAAERALEVVEAVWPVATELYGTEKASPEQPFEIHLYRGAHDYEVAEARLTGGRFRRNLAFAEWNTRTAHVAVQPALPDGLQRRLGLGFQTERLLVHEASHLVRFWAYPNYRSHPDWFSDGNATWIETRVMTQLGQLTDPADDPTFAKSMLRAQDLLAHEQLPSVDRILTDGLDDCSFYDRYALRWLLFDLLMSDPYRQATRQTLADLRHYGGGRDYAHRMRNALSRHLGTERFAQLEKAFPTRVGALRPAWNQVRRLLETAGDDWLQSAFPRLDAVCWSRRPVAAERWILRGAVTVLPDDAERMAVLFGTPGDPPLQVLFAAGHPLEIVDCATKGESRLAVADSAAVLPRGEPIPFELEIRGRKQLRVSAAGTVLEVDLGNARAASWGLAALAGSTGQWRKITAGRKNDAGKAR